MNTKTSTAIIIALALLNIGVTLWGVTTSGFDLLQDGARIASQLTIIFLCLTLREYAKRS